jgi:hypothetical protein
MAIWVRMRHWTRAGGGVFGWDSPVARLVCLPRNHLRRRPPPYTQLCREREREMQMQMGLAKPTTSMRLDTARAYVGLAACLHPVSQNGYLLSRRGRSLTANASGFDTHCDPISIRFDCSHGSAYLLLWGLLLPAAAAVATHGRIVVGRSRRSTSRTCGGICASSRPSSRARWPRPARRWRRHCGRRRPSSACTTRAMNLARWWR